MNDSTSTMRGHRLRIAGIVALLAIAVFGVYRYAGAQNTGAQAVAAATNGSGAQGQAVSTGGGTGGGGGCACGGGGSSKPVEGTAKLTGDLQTISVDLSSGGYNPNVIKLKAGVPAEITFGQSAGCTGSVQSQDLGFQADLTAGPQTVKLRALTAGTYGFACGMGMVTGQIVVS